MNKEEALVYAYLLDGKGILYVLLLTQTLQRKGVDCCQETTLRLYKILRWWD
jgi:hypothetical protein